MTQSNFNGPPLTIGFYVNNQYKYAFSFSPGGDFGYLLAYELEKKFDHNLAGNLMRYPLRIQVTYPDFKFKLTEDEWGIFETRWNINLDNNVYISEKDSKLEKKAFVDSLSYRLISYSQHYDKLNSKSSNNFEESANNVFAAIMLGKAVDITLNEFLLLYTEKKSIIDRMNLIISDFKNVISSAYKLAKCIDIHPDEILC